MTPVVLPPTTPWAAGRLRGRGAPALVFGRMFEDPCVELAAFRDRPRVLAIASAGDTAIALACAGHDVTAIDINPAQIAYVEERLRGGAPRLGQADRLLKAGRLLLRPMGWTARRLRRLSAMTDCAQQVAQWRSLLSGPPGLALRMLLAPAALRLGYGRAFAPAAAHLGVRAGLLPRIERGLAVHENRDNPWAQLLFTGRWPSRCGTPLLADLTVTPITGDVVPFLERGPPGRYDAFALSNVLDGAPDDYRRRLIAAVRRAGTPGAVVVLRTLATPSSARDATAAVRDRALVWGGLTVSTIEELPR